MRMRIHRSYILAMGQFLSLGAAILCSLASVVTFSSPFQSAKAVIITPDSMAARFGGWCETGCETTSEHCTEHSPSICGLNTITCIRCSSDTQQEDCKDWGLCIPYISCSNCVPDKEHDCGTQQIGTCESGSCVIDITDGGVCKKVKQCHTE